MLSNLPPLALELEKSIAKTAVHSLIVIAQEAGNPATQQLQ